MIWDVLIDRKGGKPYPDRIIAAESAERRYRCVGHFDCSVLPTNSELLPLAYSGRAAGAGCSTGNLFESGALAGFLWWIPGGIPSLSVQNRKKHLHRSEPYDEADGGIVGKLAGRTCLSGKRLCCGRGGSKPASADGPAGAGTAGTGIAAVRTTA